MNDQEFDYQPKQPDRSHRGFGLLLPLLVILGLIYAAYTYFAEARTQ